MLDIKPLEKKWKQYKKNRRKPWYKGVVVVFLVGIFFLFGFYKKIDFIGIQKFFSSFQIKLDSTQDVNQSNNKIKHKALLNPPLYTLQIKKIKKENQNENPSFKENKQALLFENIPLLDEGEESLSREEKLELPTFHKMKKLNIEMIDMNTVIVYKDIEKRFLQTHDIDDALFLAKNYYAKKKYQKAKYWALQTNKLDETVEESLFIFIKSKIKLGQKNEAIAILMSYLQKTNSKKAKKLLYKIKKNKL